MNETIDDRLKRLNAELDKMLYKTSEGLESNLQKLIRFGLSKAEAKGWLRNEPNYNRRKVTALDQEDKTDEEEPESLVSLYKGGIDCSEQLASASLSPI